MPSSRFRFGNDSLVLSGFKFEYDQLIVCLLRDSDLTVTVSLIGIQIRQRPFKPMPSPRFRFDNNRLVSSGFRFDSDHLILCLFQDSDSPKLKGHLFIINTPRPALNKKKIITNKN